MKEVEKLMRDTINIIDEYEVKIEALKQQERLRNIRFAKIIVGALLLVLIGLIFLF